MKFKTRIISTAVAAAVGTFAGAAQAVNLGNDGMGQVLIYPYYTVQQKGTTAFDTYISVVNSDSVNGKAVKVRILEGKNSVEVLDFNLYMSPNDVWTATLTRDASGNGVLQTTDNSCTVPEILTAVGGASSTTAGVLRQQPFTNVGYAADAVKDATMGRAREGYVEIIQMADIVPGVLTNGTPALNTFAASLHGSNSVPANCAGIRNAWSPADPSPNDFNTPANDGVRTPTGGLSGAGTIINPLEGTDYSYDAVAIDRFSNVPLHFAPGSIQPQLADVTPKNSAVFSGTDIVITNWTGQAPGVLPITALLMRNNIVNVYSVGATGTAVGTDWIVTFPTKRQHVSTAVTASTPPFTSILGTTGACETVSATAYNREEQVQTSPLGFSPPTPAGVFQLCWEANVVSMANGSTTSNVFGGANTRSTLSVPYADGWLRMGFAQSRAAPVGASIRLNIETAAITAPNPVYVGLPATGFAGIGLVNTGTLPNTNYGGVYSHSYLRNIAP